MNAHAARIRESLPQRTGDPAVNISSAKKQPALPPQAAHVPGVRCAMWVCKMAERFGVAGFSLANQPAAFERISRSSFQLDLLLLVNMMCPQIRVKSRIQETYSAATCGQSGRGYVNLLADLVGP